MDGIRYLPGCSDLGKDVSDFLVGESFYVLLELPLHKRWELVKDIPHELFLARRHLNLDFLDSLLRDYPSLPVALGSWPMVIHELGKELPQLFMVLQLEATLDGLEELSFEVFTLPGEEPARRFGRDYGIEDSDHICRGISDERGRQTYGVLDLGPDVLNGLMGHAILILGPM